MTCKVCVSNQTARTFEVSGFALSRCQNCSHLYVSSEIPNESLAGAYKEDYYKTCYNDYLGTANNRIKAFEGKLASVERYSTKGGSLLDYGCAVGLFLKVAKDAGWNARGYERSAWAVDYGKKNLGVDIELGDGSNDVFPPNSFDVVTLWDVLEHLENPRAVLESIERWLRPGGLLALNTVNSSSLGARMAGKNWRHFVPPYHLQFFTLRSLRCLLKTYGFRVNSIKGEGVLFAARHLPDRHSCIRTKLNKIIRYWRLRSLVTSLNLLDEVYVFAFKENR